MKTNRIEMCRGFDPWSAVHFLGGYFLMSVITRLRIVASLGALWECFDFIYSFYAIKYPKLCIVLDPRGADVTDFVLVVLGGLLWVGLRYLNIV